MNCPKCGAELPEGSVFCQGCGAQLQQNGGPERQNQGQQGPEQAPYQQPDAQPYVYGGNAPDNTQNAYYKQPSPLPPDAKPLNGTTYLVLAILSTVLCCLPAGIVAIIYATKIDRLMSMGDYIGAQDSAGKAKLWTIISAILGAVLVVVIIGIFFLFFGTIFNDIYY